MVIHASKMMEIRTIMKHHSEIIGFGVKEPETHVIHI